MSSAHLLNSEDERSRSICNRFCGLLSGRRRTATPRVSIDSQQSMDGPVELQQKEGDRASSSRARMSKVTNRSSMFSAVSAASSDVATHEHFTVREALEAMRISCKVFEAQGENLPRGTEEAVKGLRSRVEELQGIVDSAEAWEKKCPNGGKLLWVQISPAAGDEEPPEWALGNLYVTKDCLFFEAKESPPWSIGPIMWKDIVRVEMLQNTKAQDVSQSTPCDVRLHYTGGITSALRLQLSLVDVAWLERALPSGVELVPLEPAAAVEEPLPKPDTTRQLSGSKESEWNDSFSLPGVGQSMSKLTASFMAIARDMNKSNTDAVSSKDPLFTITLRDRDASIDAIRDCIMMKEGFIEQYVKNKLEGSDISSTAWSASRRLPGTFISRLRWQMRVPTRLPEDLSRIIDVPDMLSITLMSRLISDDTGIVLMQRGLCQNMPYGENVIVESFYTFRFNDDCSIVLNAFEDVRWSIELSPSHAALGSFIESTARSYTADLGKEFAQRFGGNTDLPMIRESSIALHEAVVTTTPLLLTETLHLTGLFTKWATNFEGGRLQPVSCDRPGFAKLRLCVRLTSESLSFAVVSGRRGWDWRLYPRDAVPIKIGFIRSHVSKEGMLTCGDPDAVAVALGNLRIGHGLNFHVLEKEGTVVTVWVEVPVTQSGKELLLNTGTADGARVWYTREDTGVHHVAGDGMDLSKYRKWLPPRTGQ